MTTTSDREALLLAIAREPSEDTPRLALADWLDEHGDGEGRVRAEFIRAQVELTTEYIAEVREGVRYYNQWPATERLRILEARESELLRTHEAAFRRSVPCPECREGNLYWPGRAHHHGGEVTECPACHGSGDAGGLLRKFQYPVDVTAAMVGQYEMDIESGVSYHAQPEPVHITEWSRGFPAAIAVPRLSDVWGQVDCPSCFGSRRVAASEGDRQVCCPTCNGKGTKEGPTPWARAVCKWNPVMSIVPLDRVPERWGNHLWMWHSDNSGEPDDLPMDVFKMLAATTATTREAAMLALGTALARLVRQEKESR